MIPQALRRPGLIAGFLFATLAGRAAGDWPAGWFPWPAVEPQPGSALDLSFLNPPPGPDGLPRVGVKDGHFATPDGQRLRFWGANLAAITAFPPTPADADFIARELARGGVNLVRLHHLDNAWGVGHGGSIWPAGHPEHRELDPTQLDRLHRLIAALRDHGIYSNLNLKVSKTLVAADGFPESVTQLANFQKRVDMFDRHMIELQKDYARRLLTTKNPYTGLAPAADPSVAVVEINNENSLVGYWTRDLGRGLDRLPEYFRNELQTLWNQWLARHYADEAALAQAWAPAPAGSETSLIPVGGRWSKTVLPGAKAELTPGPDAAALEINVDETDGIEWHVQVTLHGLPLQDGAVYTVEFQAQADRARQFGVSVGLDPAVRPGESWRSFGLLDQAKIGPDWTTVRMVFPAHSIAGAPAALNLTAGAATGKVRVKGLRLFAGSAAGGIRPGQAARSGTVPIPSEPTARQWADWISFLADTERAYTDEMRAYLKNDLHVQALVVCTPIDYGGLTGLHREQPMDFADGHAYWQHPDFPGGWSTEFWSIRNSSEIGALSDRAFGVLGDLALVRVAHKPYTISEFDHPYPNEYACEMYPTVASFGGRQDWDAVYPFAVGEYGRANPDGRITDFFDQLHHPAKRGLSPFAALVFRRGLVPPAADGVELVLGAPVWGQQPHADTLWQQLLPAGRIDYLNQRFAVSDQPGAPGAAAALARTSGPATAPAPVRLVKADQGPVWVIDTPGAAAAVGFVGGAKVDAGALRVACGRFGVDFASVTAVALDGKSLGDSGRVLVTVVARASNLGIAWNPAHNSLGKNWGHGPTIAEHVPATVSLAVAGAREVCALAPDGTRAKSVKSTLKDGWLTFAVDGNDRTIEYEVVSR